MNKLTAGQLIMINQKLVKKKFDISEKTQILIEEIVQMPYEQNEMSLYKYKGVIQKASKLGSAISRIRPFDDRNDQTAVIAALTLLELNGIKMTDYKDNVSQLVQYFLIGDIESGCEWIRKRCVDSETAYR